MTLDEAIKHAEEVAEEKENEAQDLEYSKLDWKYEANKCSKCAEEHRQLAEWLKELKEFRERNEKMREALSEKFAYMNTCLNERDIILSIACGKQRSEINHCNTDCQNTACESYRYFSRKICDTRKHDPPSKKWPCVDCDMREPADRWERRIDERSD